MSRNFCHGVIATWVLVAPALLWGCAPAAAPASSYSLVGQVVPVTGQGNIVAAVIDVTGGGCNVRVVTLTSTKAWIPSCRINKDQDAYKSFEIAGKTVELGEVNGSFKVLGGSPPGIPVAAGTHDSADAASTTSSLAFPDTWDQQPYPGQMKLRGQNAGFMITQASLTINGSRGILNVTYKTTYTPLHLTCTVTADQNGDLKLAFDPAALVQLAGRGTYTVDLVSEGQSIAGDTWESSDFTKWQPAMPPRWVRVSD